jgi:hypothetical protein
LGGSVVKWARCGGTGPCWTYQLAGMLNMLSQAGSWAPAVAGGLGGSFVDPVTLIVAALAAGVSAGMSDTASQAIKDAYAALKGLIRMRFAGNAKAEETLADYEADPDIYEKPLAKQLKAAGADEDAEIVQAAEQLLRLADAAGVKTKHRVLVRGGKVGIIGDHGHIDRLSY